MQTLSDFTFLHPIPAGRRLFAWGCLGLVYLLGILWFGMFFEWGRDMTLFHDWADVNAPRLTFLRSAVQNGQFPLHISDADAMHGNITRYLTIPDTFISPQLLLLARFSILRFNLINVLLLYTAGFAGLLALRSRLKLSLFAFTLAALLFNFNANILAHYSVGHLTWGGYFLFTWFILLIVHLLDGDRSWRWTFWVASLLFLIWLQGSFHQFIWLILFLGLCALTIRGAFWPVLRAILCTLCISAFRLLPPMLLLGEYTARFNGGYPGLKSLLDAFIQPVSQSAPFPVPLGFNSAGGWEFTTYIGLAALLALVYFGVLRGLILPASPFRPLAIPLAGMLLLSLNDSFAWLRLVPLPLIQGERVVTRISSLVLAFLIVIAAERYQRWFEAHRADARVPTASLVFALLALSEAWLSIQTWRVATIQKLFLPANFYPDKWFVANDYTDTLYLGLVYGGLAISILTALGLFWLGFVRKRAEQAFIPTPRQP